MCQAGYKKCTPQEMNKHVQCYRCALNTRTRDVIIDVPVPEYQLLLDLCRIDDFDFNEACKRIFNIGLSKLRRVAHSGGT